MASSSKLRQPARTRQQDSALADLGQTFAALSRRLARQGRRVRRLALRADQVATERGIAVHGGDKRQRAAREEIRDLVGYHAAWARWSATSDELATLAGRIVRFPVWTVNDLTVKFAALLWQLVDDGAVVDTAAERNARRFGRELRRLATRIR